MEKSFRYAKAATVTEALELLREQGSLIYAGGTDVLVKMRAGYPAHLLVDIKGLAELQGIFCRQDGSWWIGALTTMRELWQHQGVKSHFPALAEAAAVMGCYEIQGRATIGGNIVNASPGAETASPLLIYEAEAMIRGPGGKRRVPVRDFWQGPGRTVLQKEEIVLGFELPSPPAGSLAVYKRLARSKGMDLASLGLAVLVSNKDACNPTVKIAVGAMAPTPVRVPKVETFFLRQGINPHSIREAKDLLAEILKPRATSLRATPGYKKKAVGSLLEIGLEQLGISVPAQGGEA